MGDDNAVPPSKKRAAGREISRDNPGLDDEEDVSEMETGTFKKASDEVLASRRIVKVRRKPPSSPTSAPSSNPFAGIRLVPPTTSDTVSELQATSNDKVNSEADEKAQSNKDRDREHKLSEGDSEVKIDKAADVSSAGQEKLDNVEKTAQETSPEKQQANGDVKEEAEIEPADEKAPETDDKEKEEAKPKGDNALNEDDAGADASPFGSFQQLSSGKNAFSGLSGTGFSSSSFSFGSVSKDGSPSIPSFSFGASNNGSTSLLASGNKSMQEVAVETGEESEDTVFTADSALFEFFDGGWKERGKGEVKLNVPSTANKKSRLVMRARGNYRLILNANLYPDMKLTKMDKKGITFVCVNSATEGKTGLATFALKFKDASFVETFSAAVESHKGEAGTAASSLKTPENSPDAAQV